MAVKKVGLNRDYSFFSSLLLGVLLYLPTANTAANATRTETIIVTAAVYCSFSIRAKSRQFHWRLNQHLVFARSLSRVLITLDK